jgi:hypothetical protein
LQTEFAIFILENNSSLVKHLHLVPFDEPCLLDLSDGQRERISHTNPGGLFAGMKPAWEGRKSTLHPS